jgi:alpha-L-rhamnosidase
MSTEPELNFQIVDLRCERFIDPIGLDVPHPRLSWRANSDLPGFKQRAYRISVGSQAGLSDFWDSGEVETSQSQEIAYAGCLLQSGAIAYWQVSVTNVAGEVATSQGAKWEAGLGSEWPDDWIQTDIVGGPRSSPTPAYLRKTFELGGSVRSARLYVTALGLYEARINGIRVGATELAPGWTDYRKRVRYQTYDVSDLLRPGQNCLGAILGDGWYCGHVGWLHRQYYGDRPKLLAHLTVELEDGTTFQVGTNSDWQFSTGAIQAADLLMGEVHDLRLEKMGWDTPEFDPCGWRATQTVPIATNLESQNSPSVHVEERLHPVSVKEISSWPTHRYIFDMGQNMVGRVKLSVEGEAGQTLSLRYAERLDPSGNLYTLNYRFARSIDHVTLKGGGLETFEPNFTFHGFQYVEIAGLTSPPPEGLLTGIVLHSDWQPTGAFRCSNPQLNQLFANINWGWKGNSVDVPTDCPQRDERLGWTGDAQVFVRTACFLGDVQGFFEKFQQDLADSQHSNGVIPAVAPDTKVTEDGGPAWADAFVICPWTIYRYFGDVEILAKHYPAMKRWVASLELSSENLIRSFEDYAGFKGFGDWLSTNAETPIDLIGTAFYAYTASLMSDIAGTLGFEVDRQAFKSTAESVTRAFQNRFVTGAGLVASGSQTSYVLALSFDLLPETLRAEAVKLLVADIKKRGWKLSTGFVGTPYLLHVLTKFGQIEIAYKLLMQTEWPSWLYPVTQGATTIWERWDGWTEDKGFQDPGMNSFNHYAYGAVGDWLVSTVAGLGLDENVPAYQKSVLAPLPGGGLTQAAASLATRYGVLSSDWEIREGKFLWHIAIPPNTSAQIEFPVQVVDPHFEGTPCNRSFEQTSGRFLLTGTWTE